MNILHPYVEGTSCMILKILESLRQVLFKTNGTNILARWRVRIFEFMFHIVHFSGIIHQTVETMPPCKSKGEDKAPLDDESVALTISSKYFGCAAVMETVELETIMVLKDSFVSFIPGVCVMEDIRNNDKEKIVTLVRLHASQYTKLDCLTAFPSIENPVTRFKVYSSWLLTKVPPLDDTPQRVLPTSTGPLFLYHCHHSHQICHSGDRLLYDSTWSEWLWLDIAGEV